MGKMDYKLGERINDIIYIRDIEPYVEPNGKKRRKALFICPYCGNTFEAVIKNIRRLRTKSCGCLRIKKATTHGLRGHPLYTVWINFKNRCYNPNDVGYKNYGERDIKVFNKWRNDFKAFYNWCIINGYKKELEIDRINNDGNYEPNNCRFTTKHIQNTNQRIQKNNTSGYVGVYFKKRINRWVAKIGINNKRITLGSFIKKQEALKSRNNYILKNNLTEYKIQLFIN